MAEVNRSLLLCHIDELGRPYRFLGLAKQSEDLEASSLFPN